MLAILPLFFRNNHNNEVNITRKVSKFQVLQKSHLRSLQWKSGFLPLYADRTYFQYQSLWVIVTDWGDVTESYCSCYLEFRTTGFGGKPSGPLCRLLYPTVPYRSFEGKQYVYGGRVMNTNREKLEWDVSNWRSEIDLINSERCTWDWVSRRPRWNERRLWNGWAKKAPMYVKWYDESLGGDLLFRAS